MSAVSTTGKIQLWERKLLDLSMANDLINMAVGKNAVPFPTQDVALLEDELDMGEKYDMQQPELVPIYRAARTNMEESGANSLFITLGTLHWSDSEKSGLAPILLIPVDMKPTQVEDKFSIKRRDEKALLNVTLMEYLSYNFGIKVPEMDPLPEDEHGIDVNLVLNTVKEAVAKQKGWTIEEDSYIGIFSFSKYVMWNDIHANAERLKENDLVRSMIEGRLLLKQDIPATDSRKLDANNSPADFALPVDCDSSQFEAVADCGKGRTFLLYGPPGTGKSQTITNMIANALYTGKRVLFVAQKKAALDVVQNRLNKIGIGRFCMELHSNKVDKKHFLEQLDAIIECTSGDEISDFEEKSITLYRKRKELLDYIEALHLRRPIGYSLFECIDRYLNIDGPLIALPTDFVGTHTREDVERIYERCLSLDSGEEILGMDASIFPLAGLNIKPVQKPRFASSLLPMPGDTLEGQLSQLPAVVDNCIKQVERMKSMTFIKRTAQQQFEMDYKWKKFLQKVDVDTALYDDLPRLRETVIRWSNNVDKLPLWEKYNKRFDDLRNDGLQQLIEMYANGVSTQDIANTFLKSYYHESSLYIIEHDESLKKFNGLVFQQVIDKYKALTKEFQHLTREELAWRLAMMVNADIHDPELSAELTLLRRRIGNGGRGATVRGMIDQMPNLLNRLCPCMLMSPISVAQFLNINSPKFDVVIFDEASQMPTAEAVGSLVRANSAVVVGDPRQMPPTSFFSVKTTSEEESDIDDQESILDELITLSVPSRYLGWHYRSKHESLIAFCNHNFYDGGLVTFPSVDDMVSHISYQQVDGVYENSHNKEEAAVIVEDIINRLKNDDGKSIGVVAFSKSQSDTIESLLYRELAKYPELDALDKAREEPVFVKNLENVQGDERDVILFSIGYGPDSKGKVANNFGPLRLPGGERRLNVAASRARYEMKVFSSIKPEQIDDRKTDAKGVTALKNFLLFAQHGATVQASKYPIGQKTCNHMTSQIVEEIQKAGYDTMIGVGSSKFKVDIAVVNPNNSTEYLLGIVCDGKGYYQLKTTRDREIVQPGVLNVLGWNLIHVWSIDWLRKPQSVVNEIITTIKQLTNKG